MHHKYPNSARLKKNNNSETDTIGSSANCITKKYVHHNSMKKSVIYIYIHTQTVIHVQCSLNSPLRMSSANTDIQCQSILN